MPADSSSIAFEAQSFFLACVPKAGLPATAGTVLWFRLRVASPFAELGIVGRTADRLGEHPVGFVDLSYALFGLNSLLRAARESVRVVDFDEAAVSPFDSFSGRLSWYAQSVVMRRHGPAVGGKMVLGALGILVQGEDEGNSETLPPLVLPGTQCPIRNRRRGSTVSESADFLQKWNDGRSALDSGGRLRFFRLRP